MGENNLKQNRNRGFMDKKSAVTAAISFAVFAVISYFVVTQETLAFDTVIREYIYSLRSEGLTSFFMLTYLGNWHTISLICLLFLLIPMTRRPVGIPVSAAAILASLIQKALKVSFHRARPDLALHLISQGGYSFPSGHSFSVLIFYGMLLYLSRINIKNRTAASFTTVLLLCLIVLIGFSRIYLGVHYPSDVIGGWSLGICVLTLLISGHKFLRNSRI